MEANKILQLDILDIIFENRNKDYGAYELRRNYEKRAKRAVFTMLILLLAIVSVPLLAGLAPEKIAYNDPTSTDVRELQDIRLQDDHVKVETNTIDATPPDPTPNIPTEIVEADQFIKPIIDEQVPDLGQEHQTTGSEEGETGLPTSGEGASIGGTGTGTAIVIEETTETNTVFETESVEQLPEFPGGEEAMMDFLKKNMKYPDLAVRSDVEGKVVVGFLVTKEGEIGEIKVLKELGAGCDQEAVRVIKNMPNWKPGKNNGKPVNVYFNLPIEFEIDR